MGRFNRQKKNLRHVHYEQSQPSYDAVRKSRFEVRMRRKYGDSVFDGWKAEATKERRAAEAAEGPSPAQRMRFVELLAEKANCLKRVTTAKAKVAAAKKALDEATARYEKAKEEKRVMEAEYRDILAELRRIPAELPSSRRGMLRSGGDIVTKEEGENVAKQEGENAVKQEGGNVMKQDEGRVVKME
ncbi:hypothetical protein VE00_00233 [Pseudogymnoascus sp. WSF 3629]|nr:hypothetical protein VE00_00233 [Pseudogymnoascus sp. WSF 3629]